MTRLSSINNTFDSYQKLIALYQEHKEKMFDDISIELSYFFSANMCAALGAILDRFKSNLNDIHFVQINPEIERILLKNDFLTYYGRNRALDTHNTTIKFQKLKKTDGKFFKNYVMDELIEGHRSDLPKMSSGVKEKIIEAIYEIFVNAQIHSETEFIYTCGQFFPNKNKIEFTIVDTGIGFKNRINKRFNTKVSAEKAILWAVRDKNTTKEGITGGLGLAILKEFIQRNRGKMQIVSNEGYYQFDASSEVTKAFRGEFPGTIVNLQFSTDDKSNYTLKGEVNLDDIF
ncbi:ATP-binding protein [Algoriphagus sp. H41]|uniref:ATP-binding protein n=1 Tax=Algoriphagus oliviformis TaxID=2811231 RepID=A0ABS3C3F2_9BACT|nr:ATP-binding protein [Algoriphagus oliviformis]MBN7811503.1 ATP-binding protein [Algoriphagus oliviformis]